MSKQPIVVAVLMFVLGAGCNVLQDPNVELKTESSNPLDLEVHSEEISLPPEEMVGPDCLGDEISPIGQSIADTYQSASYEQVMTWFCNGAEFEDILVALETESLSDTPADEMLQMLADDFTWDDIWLFIGLTD